MLNETLPLYKAIKDLRSYIYDVIVKLPNYLKHPLGKMMCEEMFLAVRYLAASLLFEMEVLQGVKFVGAVIKPGRTYVSGRSIDRLRGKLLRLPADMDINKVTATINSYYGLFGQYHSYNIRKQYASIILNKWGEKLYFTNDYGNVKIKKRFTDKWKNIERVRRMRKLSN